MLWGRILVTLGAIAIVVIAVYYVVIAPVLAPPPAPAPAGSVAFTATSAQDAQRLSDMHSLDEALSAYFKDHAAYPPAPVGTTCGTTYNNLDGLTDALVPQYIKAIPKDPNPRACVYNYVYWSDGKNYALMVALQGVDPYKYNDHWCIGAGAGTIPDLHAYLPCPQ